MKTLINNTSQTKPGASIPALLTTKRNTGDRTYLGTLKAFAPEQTLLKSEAIEEVLLGQIPDIQKICAELFNTFKANTAPYSALQFVSVLQNAPAFSPGEIRRFLNNPTTNHVLVQNELMKVVLIHWKPGKLSSIHGHPSGGCVFKVLQGQLEELRYTTDNSPKLLSTSTLTAGGMAYIDDRMGYHAVGNPTDTSAISIHAYTPGIKK